MDSRPVPGRAGGSRPCQQRHSCRAQAGFTLVEVLVAMVILLAGVLAAVSALNAASRVNAGNRQRDTATSLAREVTEAARSVRYDRLTATGIAAELQAVPGLEDGSGGGYDIKRQDVNYTLKVDVCVMDDPTDGGGPRFPGSEFCPGSASPGTRDSNPEDYKRVTATVSWANNGAARSTTLTETVNNPGSASGPAVRSIAPSGYSSPFVITNELTTSLQIDITTSSRPAAINWLLDGTVQQPVPVMNGPSGQAWRAIWNLGGTETGVLDGDYIISADAVSQYGLSGPTRQETVILNRRRPFAPRQVTGGRTGLDTVEIEWTANRERDIAGYEVRREGAAGPVCPLQAQKLDTVCIDRTAPAGVTLRYRVVAYDKDPLTGNTREGDLSAPLDVVEGNTRPNPPTDLTVRREADGSVTLTWRRPSPADPDPGDGVEFYRVYRDGTELGDRYARWFDGAATVTWRDLATGGSTHTYRVRAVDKHYAESDLLGPVTG